MGDAPDAQQPSLLRRLRDRYRWLDNLSSTLARYIEFNGDHYAAAITYYSLLAIVPLVMITVSVTGFVVAGDQQMIGDLQTVVSRTLPRALSGDVNELMAKVIDNRSQFGILGLVVAIYSGWSWISNVRDALTAMWGEHRQDAPLLRMVLTDVLTLIGLGAALVFSFALTVFGSGLNEFGLGLLGLTDTPFARITVVVSTVVLALLTNWLVLLWIIARLPRKRVSWRAAARGALYAALGFEILKQLGNLYLRLLSFSPTVVAFGALIGLLIFIYFAARMLLLVTVWTAIRTRLRYPGDVQAPPPVVIRPAVVEGPSRLKLVAVAVGSAVVTHLLGRRRRR